MNGILTLEFEPRLDNVQVNLETVETLIKNCGKKLDLVVFPEFFSTGIINGFTKSASKTEDSYVLKSVSNLAKKFDTNICAGTVIEADGGKFYNTSYVFDRNGEILGKYRKIHLFSYMGGNEDMEITKGDEISVLELDFARLGLSICFDIRFPLHFNKLIKAGAEIIVCPNAWCTPMNFSSKIREIKTNEMKSFAVARASENLVYFIGSSLSGKLGSGLISSGGSIIVSPDGEILAENGTGYAQIDLKKVREYKKSFPVYKID